MEVLTGSAATLRTSFLCMLRTRTISWCVCHCMLRAMKLITPCACFQKFLSHIVEHEPQAATPLIWNTLLELMLVSLGDDSGVLVAVARRFAGGIIRGLLVQTRPMTHRRSAAWVALPRLRVRGRVERKRS